MSKVLRSRSFGRLLLLGMMLLGLALATESVWVTPAEAMPCCSDCDSWEDPMGCWRRCSMSC